MNNDRELAELFAKARDDSLSLEAFRRLEERLRSSAEDREHFLRFQQLHGLLETMPPCVDEAAIETSLRRDGLLRFPARVAAVVIAAAATLAVAGLVWFETQAPVSEPPSIATLLLAEDSRWERGGPILQEGQPLGPGPLRLLEGSAMVRFAGGAEVALTGDTEIDLISVRSVRLRRGEAVIRAEEGAEGFTVVTPKGAVIDLGTEFAVRVENSGATELHVHEGEVAIKESIVPAGRAIRLDQSKTTLEAALNAPRFSEVVQRSNPRERRDLMWAYEGFHVDEGAFQPGELDTGKGWDGPWRLRERWQFGTHKSDTSTDMRITHGQMDMAWPVKGGRLGMLELPPGRNIRLRTLARPIDLTENGITYLSFLAAEGDARGDSEITDDAFRLTLRSSEDYFGESLSFGWSKQRRPHVQTGNGALRRSLRRVPADETVFCVAKVIHASKRPDQVLFRFYRENDQLDIFEPPAWDIEIHDVDLDAELDLLLLTTNSPLVRYVDEIRIGPTWRSVTPIK